MVVIKALPVVMIFVKSGTCVFDANTKIRVNQLEIDKVEISFWRIDTEIPLPANTTVKYKTFLTIGGNG